MEADHSAKPLNSTNDQSDSSGADDDGFTDVGGVHDGSVLHEEAQRFSRLESTRDDGLRNDKAVSNAETAFRHLRQELNDQELAGTVAGVCRPTTELEKLRQEFGKLQRRHAAMTARLSTLEDELSRAGAVQREIDAAPMPSLSEGSILRYQRPAEPVSGDLCIIERLGDSRVSIVLADATGHGVSAAMLTAFCRPLFANRASAGASVTPSSVLRHVNAAICDLELSGCQFLSAVVADYDESTRTLTWSRAGAPYPVVSNPNRRPESLDGGGPLLGMTEEAEYEDLQRTLDEGDRLMIFTDGLEALLQRATGICPSTEWFASLANEDVREVVHGLDRSLQDLNSDSWDPDDVSLVVLDCLAHSL